MICPEAAVAELSIYSGAVSGRDEASLQEAVTVPHPPPVPESVMMEDVPVMNIHQDSINVHPRPGVIYKGCVASREQVTE